MKNMLLTDYPISVFDLETSGTHDQAEILEITIIRLEKNQQPKIILDTLIAPKGKIAHSDIHQIYAETLIAAPSFEEVLPSILSAIEGTILCAYNSSFDVNFLRKRIEQLLGIHLNNPPHFCARFMANMLGLGLKQGKLAQVCEEAGIDFGSGHHIAVYDTWMTSLLACIYFGRFKQLRLESYQQVFSHFKKKYAFAQSFDEPFWDIQKLREMALMKCSQVKKQAVLIGGSRQFKSRYAAFKQLPIMRSSFEDLPPVTPAPYFWEKPAQEISKPQVQAPQSKPQAQAQATQSHFKLRPYQEEAIKSILSAFQQRKRRILVSLPTGAGKTVIFSALSSKAQKRVLVLAHREELLYQAKEKLQHTLGADHIVSIEQGNQYADPNAKVVVASLRSLRADRFDQLIKQGTFGLIIYDECHHAVAEDNQRILKQVGVFDPSFQGFLVGFTATTQRADGKALLEVFDEIVYSRNLYQMIDDGYLVPLKGYRISTDVTLDLKKTQGLDFNTEELEEKVDIQERNGLVARSILELARDRRTICFCVTVAHAENLAKTLRDLHVPAAVIHGELKSDERARILKDFREGILQVLTNVGVLTEGFDDPGVSCIAMARPTKSEALYIQCVGRGMRLADQKKDCLVLDFVDLSHLNLVTLPTLFGMPKEINLNGERADEVASQYEKLILDNVEVEWEAQALTIQDLREKIEVFDPLKIKLSPEIKAISDKGWCSLGQRGLVLHFFNHKNKQMTLYEIAILLTSESGSKRYQVLLNDREMARFASIEQAVNSCDYEVDQMGYVAQQTAQCHSPWRFNQADEALASGMRADGLKVQPSNLEELFRGQSYLKYVLKKG